MAFMKGSPLCPAPTHQNFVSARSRSSAKAGRSNRRAADLGIHEVTLHSWLRQDDIDHGRRPGDSTREAAGLRV